VALVSGRSLAAVRAVLDKAVVGQHDHIICLDNSHSHKLGCRHRRCATPTGSSSSTDHNDTEHSHTHHRWSMEVAVRSNLSKSYYPSSLSAQRSSRFYYCRNCHRPSRRQSRSLGYSLEKRTDPTRTSTVGSRSWASYFDKKTVPPFFGLS
jgi:hypothetical protein